MRLFTKPTSVMRNLSLFLLLIACSLYMLQGQKKCDTWQEDIPTLASISDAFQSEGFELAMQTPAFLFAKSGRFAYLKVHTDNPKLLETYLKEIADKLTSSEGIVIDMGSLHAHETQAPSCLLSLEKAISHFEGPITFWTPHTELRLWLPLLQKSQLFAQAYILVHGNEVSSQHPHVDAWGENEETLLEKSLDLLRGSSLSIKSVPIQTLLR